MGLLQGRRNATTPQASGPPTDFENTYPKFPSQRINRTVESPSRDRYDRGQMATMDPAEMSARSIAGTKGFFPDENPNPVLRMSGDGALVYANRSAAPILAAWGVDVGGQLPGA